MLATTASGSTRLINRLSLRTIRRTSGVLIRSYLRTTGFICRLNLLKSSVSTALRYATKLSFFNTVRIA